MNIQQMQMPAIVNEDGELVPINQAINKQNIKDIPDEQLEDIAYTVKMFDPQINIVKAEMKKRVQDGHSFSRYILSDRAANKLDTDNNVFKQEMQIKYGWDALEVKSAAQLKKKYGEQVLTDIENHTVHGVKAGGGMAIATNRDYEPEDDPPIFGETIFGQTIYQGDEDVVQVADGYLMPNEFADYVIQYLSDPVDTNKVGYWE